MKSIIEEVSGAPVESETVVACGTRVTGVMEALEDLERLGDGERAALVSAGLDGILNEPRFKEGRYLMGRNDVAAAGEELLEMAALPARGD